MKSINIFLKDKTHRQKIRAAFSNRLSQLMMTLGGASARALHGGDPKLLAQIAGCSVVMARRYLLGQSVPNEDILEKIALWAKVDPQWLLYGDATDFIEPTFEHKTSSNKPIWVAIFNHLRPHISNLKLDSTIFEDYITFAVDIYDNVSILNIPFGDQIKMIELMAKSIELFHEQKTTKVKKSTSSKHKN